jgi:hypothetical protein
MTHATVAMLCTAALLLLTGHGRAQIAYSGTSFVSDEMSGFYPCGNQPAGTDVSCPICLDAVNDVGAKCAHSTTLSTSNLGNSPAGAPSAPFLSHVVLECTSDHATLLIVCARLTVLLPVRVRRSYIQRVHSCRSYRSMVRDSRLEWCWDWARGLGFMRGGSDHFMPYGCTSVD